MPHGCRERCSLQHIRLQGAPPLPEVLHRLTAAPDAPPLTELVMVLGDDRGVSAAEIALTWLGLRVTKP